MEGGSWVDPDSSPPKKGPESGTANGGRACAAADWVCTLQTELSAVSLSQEELAGLPGEAVRIPLEVARSALRVCSVHVVESGKG